MLLMASLYGQLVSAQGSAIIRTSTPSVSASEPLTLQQALARAKQRRPQAELAAAGVARAKGTAGLVSLIPNPVAFVQRDERTPTHQSSFTQPLAWLIRRSADVGAGHAIVDRATADSMQLMADVGRDVQRAFFGALAADERLRLGTEQAHLADSLVLFADRRVSAGDISALERDQIAQEAARARLSAAQAREAARVARVVFARAVAWNTGDNSPQATGSLTDALDALGADSVSVESTPLPSLPAMNAILADSAGAAARLRGARLAQIPVPAVVIGLEWGAVGVPTTSARDSRSTSIVGLSMPLPFWNQGREAVAEAGGISREASARVGEARLTLTAQLTIARIRVAETASRATFTRDSLFTEATRIRIGAIRLYESGRTGLLPVIDALRVERDAAQTVVQELLAFQDARADLTALLGRWP